MYQQQADADAGKALQGGIGKDRGGQAVPEADGKNDGGHEEHGDDGFGLCGDHVAQRVNDENDRQCI